MELPGKQCRASLMGAVLLISVAMRVILAGGGTGGHVIPALAIANELRDSYQAEIVFIGTARGIETRLVPQAGYKLELVEVGALKNVSAVTRARTLFDLPRAVLKCAGLYRKFKPDVVISVGGYASGPGVLAAGLRRIPVVIFEPNLVPGFANKIGKARTVPVADPVRRNVSKNWCMACCTDWSGSRITLAVGS